MNQEYAICDSYPRLLIVPARASDDMLREASSYVWNIVNETQVANFRSKGRLPVLSWYDWKTSASITRCSQPRVGMVGKRSTSDENYIDMIRLLVHFLVVSAFAGITYTRMTTTIVLFSLWMHGRDVTQWLTKQKFTSIFKSTIAQLQRDLAMNHRATIQIAFSNSLISATFM